MDPAQRARTGRPPGRGIAPSSALVQPLSRPLAPSVSRHSLFMHYSTRRVNITLLISPHSWKLGKGNPRWRWRWKTQGGRTDSETLYKYIFRTWPCSSGVAVGGIFEHRNTVSPFITNFYPGFSDASPNASWKEPASPCPMIVECIVRPQCKRYCIRISESGVEIMSEEIRLSMSHRREPGK